jgi:hypothetical protein
MTTTLATTTVKLSSILSGLSYALDLTEGHPRGHASRSCLIGMRVARVLGLSPDEQSHLFYALLLKDAGCSSNSAKVFQLFGGDERAAKRVRRFAVLAAKCPASRGMLFEPAAIAAPTLRAPSASRRSGFCALNGAPDCGPTRSMRPSEY